MHEVQQVRRGGPQALDSVPVECVDRLQHACLVVAALAFVQEAAEGALMLGVLVDIRDAQLGFPQERVVGALEYLRSEEHTSELQSLMRISYAVFCLKKKKNTYI